MTTIYMPPPGPCPLLSTQAVPPDLPPGYAPSSKLSPEEVQRNFNLAVQAAIDEMVNEFGLVATHISLPRKPPA